MLGSEPTSDAMRQLGQLRISRHALNGPFRPFMLTEVNGRFQTLSRSPPVRPRSGVKM